MARLVADTHALVWRLTAPRKLGRGAQRAFDAADSGRSLCLVPAIVFVELALLKERGRGRVGVGPADVLRAVQGRAGYTVPALDAEQALEFAAHQGIKDPMDAWYSPLPAWPEPGWSAPTALSTGEASSASGTERAVIAFRPCPLLRMGRAAAPGLLSGTSIPRSRI